MSHCDMVRLKSQLMEDGRKSMMELISMAHNVEVRLNLRPHETLYGKLAAATLPP